MFNLKLKKVKILNLKLEKIKYFNLKFEIENKIFN